MANIRFLTAGESHGKALLGILEGIPAGFSLSSSDIDADLKRRQGGYGRGSRMKIESDRAEIISGVRFGKTIGSPISVLVENRDWENWKDIMNVETKDRKSENQNAKSAVTCPRPGHADLAGALKYGHKDIRNILERSSARETATRVALGAVAKRILSEYTVSIGSYVVQIGSVKAHGAQHTALSDEKELLNLFREAEVSPVRCPDSDASKKMVKLIDRAIKGGNSLGGVFEVFISGLPVGLGSHTQWDRKLDGRLAQAVMSIQAIKGVEIGLGFEMARKFGSEVMDEILYEKAEFSRKTNNAGGIEGGISNGMPVIIRAAMKPIPTLKKPLMSTDIVTKKKVQAAYERSDICAVPAAAVVAEAMAALIILDVFLGKFGGDSKKEVTRNYRTYLSHLSRF